MSRAADAHRTTGETDVRVRIDLDGAGRADVGTGVGFFDHLLTLFARHALVDLEVAARGDLETGSHHTVEDVGITLGQVVDRALGDRAGIERYGWALLPMDECLVQAAVDVSGRPFIACDVPLPFGVVGGFETDLLEEFLRALAVNARLTLHVRLLAGANPHHVIECAVKAVARALQAAVRPNPRVSGVPSTKGSL
ncbi:MAG TPA: imidazoleglycerol-phosphate dehydratase HisB [Miltoncostaeaceae bacterium]|nr:imidazoleglycerol-phosphate dehydratase HisB [Miltoncostaeaceae bacterium]